MASTFKVKGATFAVVLYSMASVVFPFPRASIAEQSGPTVVFLKLPPYGEMGRVSGTIRGVDPAELKLALYLFTEGGGWFRWPATEDSMLSVAPDGKWDANVAGASHLAFATRMVGVLLPASRASEIPVHGACLPNWLRQDAMAIGEIERTPRMLSFSGYEWRVKRSGVAVGPGGHLFSDTERHVRLGKNGHLLMRMSVDNEVVGAEVISDRTFGYGEFRITLRVPARALSRHGVVGLFTWDNDACNPASHREIDIEFSHWGELEALNAQYVLQPWDVEGNRYRWSLDGENRLTEHLIRWEKDRLSFTSYLLGEGADAKRTVIAKWIREGAAVPAPGKARFRINTWHMNALAATPQDGFELVVESFGYKPY